MKRLTAEDIHQGSMIGPNGTYCANGWCMMAGAGRATHSWRLLGVLDFTGYREASLLSNALVNQLGLSHQILSLWNDLSARQTVAEALNELFESRGLLDAPAPPPAAASPPTALPLSHCVSSDLACLGV